MRTASPCRIFHIRHHSLYASRDFDVSPYFEMVKPTLAQGFDDRAIVWSSDSAFAPAAASGQQVEALRLDAEEGPREAGEAGVEARPRVG